MLHALCRKKGKGSYTGKEKLWEENAEKEKGGYGRKGEIRKGKKKGKEGIGELFRNLGVR